VNKAVLREPERMGLFVEAQSLQHRCRRSARISAPTSAGAVLRNCPGNWPPTAEVACDAQRTASKVAAGRSWAANASRCLVRSAAGDPHRKAAAPRQRGVEMVLCQPSKKDNTADVQRSRFGGVAAAAMGRKRRPLRIEARLQLVVFQ